MKIAYVSPRYPPSTGGLETHLSRIASRLAARGIDVEVLTQTTERSLPASEVVEGVRVRRFAVPRPTGDYIFAPALWSYLRQNGPTYDLMHAHSYHALPALAAALTKRRPLVFTPHYHGEGQSRLRRLHVPYRPVGRWIFRRSDRVICVSRVEADLVRAHVPDVANRITVIPNGVEVAELRAAQPFPEDRTVILTVGRLKPYKQVDRVVAALAHLDNRFVLEVVGDGPALPALRELAADRGLEGRVRFRGQEDEGELYRRYATAAVYVSMSAQEAFGITPLEALAAGSRVLVSDIPAHREIAGMAGEGGIARVPLDIEPRDLAAEIRRLTERRRVESSVSLPTWEDVAAETLELYRAVMAEAG